MEHFHPERAGESASFAEETGAPRAAWYPIAPVAKLLGKNAAAIELHGSTLPTRSRSRGGPARTDRDEEPLKLRAFNGLIWACPAEHHRQAVPPIALDGFRARHIVAANYVDIRADYDQVVMGLVDPAHVPLVHRSWWWRSGRSRHRKVKAYSPSPFGFTAVARATRHQSAVVRWLGLAPEISIEFRLPSLRVERIRQGDRRILNFTFVVPLRADVQRVYNVMYTNWRLLRTASPIIHLLGQRFLQQDARVLHLLPESPDRPASMLFVGDPDRPSLWYYRLKRELRRCQDEGRAFVNPVRARELSWCT